VNPDYVKWLKKPCWSKIEILYLVAGADPSHAINDEAIEVDIDSGESWPAPSDETAVALAVKLAARSTKSGLVDLLNRAIKSGDLRPTQAGVECYRPDEVVRFLLQKEFSVPQELVSTFNARSTKVTHLSNTFDSLTKALEGWFDKSLAELPADKRERVERDFPHPERWDETDCVWRRTHSEQWDFRHDPATREEMQRGLDLVNEKFKIEGQMRELELMRAQTPLELESQKRQLADLRARLEVVSYKLETGGREASNASTATETPRARRARHDIATERGCRRLILENWDKIEAEYGPNADGRQVLRVLKRNLDKGEKEPALKTIQNRLIILRNEKLIP